MILGLALSSSALSKAIVIPDQTFNKITLKGNTIFDGVHLRNKELSDDEFLAIETEEVFDINESIFLANFEGTLEAGNYTTLSKPITKWKVQRKRVGTFSTVLLAEIENSDNDISYTDNLQANRTQYEYLVTPIADDGTEGVPVTSIAETDFFGWYLCSLDNQTVYKFDMNLESDNIALNMDIKLFEGFTKYPVERRGKRQYHSGGLKTLPYSINGQNIRIDNELLQSVKAFIADGQPKLLKNTSGDLFKVTTSDFSYQYMDTYDEQPFTISFKWTQVGDGE